MVFDPATAPGGEKAFMAWYEDKTRWNEGHSYEDPAVTTPALAAWFADMRERFPNLNGPGAPDDDELDERATDYSIGRTVIYAAFAWSEAEDAYALARRLAVKHGVGFFNASSETRERWVPPTEQLAAGDIAGLTLTLEGQQPFEAPSPALIAAAVDWLEPTGGPGFLILENSGGSYAQVGGGKEECTLEWRETQGERFSHWVAGKQDVDDRTQIQIEGNGPYFTVMANEKLTNAEVLTLLLAFAEGRPRPEAFTWRDMTADFGTPTAQAKGKDKPWWQFWA